MTASWRASSTRAGAEPWKRAEPPGVIRRQVLAATVHYSTSIEGNVLSRDQVESIIAGEAVEAPHKDRTEALNYHRAMRWAQTRSQDPGWRLSNETILTLHFMTGTELGKDYEPLGNYAHATTRCRIAGRAKPSIGHLVRVTSMSSCRSSLNGSVDDPTEE